jgi:hypothetical protein
MAFRVRIQPSAVNTVLFCLQLEVLQLQGLAENLTRKCRHLQGELGEAHRAAEAAHSKLMSLQVGEGHRGWW